MRDDVRQDPAGIAAAAGASVYGDDGSAGSGVFGSASGALGSAFRCGMFASFAMLAGGRALYERAAGAPDGRRTPTTVPAGYARGSMLAALSSRSLHAGHMTPAAGLFLYGVFNYASLAVIAGKAAAVVGAGSFAPGEGAPTVVMPDYYYQVNALLAAHLVPLDERTGAQLPHFRPVPFARNDDGTFTRLRPHGVAPTVDRM